MTSDLRRGLAGLICRTVWKGESGVKQALAAELWACPFEQMATDSLVALAERFCPEADVMRLLHMLDETPYEIEQTWLCPDCRDERLWRGDDGRWRRCTRCNPRPEPVEGAKK